MSLRRPAALALGLATLTLALAVGAAVAVAATPAKPLPPTVWLCHPGVRPDPCDVGLGTTRVTPAGARVAPQRVVADRAPKLDCFYVYPTVGDQTAPVATLRIDPEERSIARFQAARYSQHCRVFAPMYRQQTLQGIFSGRALQTGPTSDGYRDVAAAWTSYLAHDNHGRGVVLIGHSQGSFVLRELIRRVIDPKPRVRRLLVSAILLGGNVEVPAGRDVGGDFQHVPACRSATQFGCVIAFSTFDQPPPATSLFGRTATPGRQVLCTNPAALAGGSGTLDPIYPTQPFAPGTLLSVAIRLLGTPLPSAPTPWVAAPGAYSASCSSAGGANVLRIVPLAGAPTFRPSPDPTWGLHLLDANVALGNLVALVGSQGRAWERARGPRT